MMHAAVRSKWCRWLGAGLAAGLVSIAAAAQTRTPEAPLERTEVRDWLLRIHEAAQRRNFQGTFVVSAGGHVASSRIAHYKEGNSQFERIESLDGKMRQVFRHNDIVATLWPGTREAVVEQRETLGSFPGLLHSDGDRIVEYYEVRRAGVDRVAGHEADVLLIQPRDAYRYGHRLWSERQSGLLLRAEVVSETEDVLESAAFSEVSIGVKPLPETVVKPMKKLDGYKVDRPKVVKTTYEKEGWNYTQKAPGFRYVNCVKRQVDTPAGTAGEGSRELLQSVFSDGLAIISVFVEPFDAQRHRKEMLMSMGATHTLMKRHKDWWVTAVGEVPPAALRVFVQGLERRK